MFNVQIKIIAASVIGWFMLSCGNGSDNEDKIAENLYRVAENSFESGDFVHAAQILDSIDHAYPHAIETREKSLLLRPQIMERHTAILLSETDSLLTVNKIKGDSLRNLITFVDNPLEGYFVASSTGNVDVRTVPGLHGRISPAFKFYLTASAPTHIKTISFRLEADGESVIASEIPYDGERNNRSGKCETLTLTEAESAPIGDFLLKHPTSQISIIYIGENGTEKHLTMLKEQRDALISGYLYAKSVIQDKYLRVEKERLAKQLEISRMQIARTQSRDN